MSFMRRGVASSSSSPATPKSQEQHSAKRRKVSDGFSADTPSNAVIDEQAIRRVLEEDEKRQQALLEKKAADLGDAHWVLEQPGHTATSANGLHTPLKVVQVGFANLDHLAANEDTSPHPSGQEVSDIPKRHRFNMKAAEASV